MKYSQKNIELLFQLIGSFPGQVYSNEKYFDYISTKDSIWPNQLINFKVTGRDISKTLDQIEKDVAVGLIPSILMLNPSSDYDLSLEEFQRRKYRSSTWTAMTHDLISISAEHTIPDLQVRLVDNKKDLTAWLELVENELMGNHSLNKEVFMQLMSHENCFFFLGIQGKQPVATSLLYLNDKHAGIYLVSTKSDYRKKGIGKEITRVCLKKARDLACNRVDIQATNLGRGVYQSLGFVDRGIINVYSIKRPSLS